LKQQTGGGASLTATTFPRLKKRGSIEAEVTAAMWTSDAAFPRLKKRGSIEANYSACMMSRDKQDFHV